ncbi:MAG: DCC1-like thiol-disulfide oxidoreductase family protein [Bryobacteraceae bacterium]|jgi:predicted DCC family thiol-disulfide oxidoreductase YuxK
MAPQTPADSAGRHLILYDAVCGLCDRLVRFVLPRDHREVFHFASLQSKCGQSLVRQFGRDPDCLDTFYVVSDYRSASPALLCRARAALFVAKALGGPWRALAVLGVLPDGLLNPAYHLVARHRYRLFGRREGCLMPPAQYQRRFIDR